MKIRQCQPGDVPAVRRLVAALPPLGVHTAFTYWVLFRFFSEVCFVAEDRGAVVGYASGVTCLEPEGALYLWQLGVVEKHRGSGLAQRLTRAVIAAAAARGCGRLLVSIEPSNERSRGAIAKVAAAMGSELRVEDEIVLPDGLTDKVEREVLYSFSIVEGAPTPRELSSGP